MDTTFLPKDLESSVEDWLSWNQSQHYSAELDELLEQRNVHKIKDAFDGRLSFGTAGLRAAMGPGFKRMNDLVVVQSAQGLLHYMLNVFGDSLKTSGIIVGYDGRYNSKRFAELTSTVFLRHSVKVYLINQVCPTPFVAFGIKQYKCCGGIMVTASHNPKQDNGYKVFWNNGAQIVFPIDKNIENSITEHLIPEDGIWNTEETMYANSLLINPLIDLQTRYNSFIDKMLFPNLEKKKTDIVFTYTPMHGVGYPYIKNVFDNAKFNPVIVVERQKDPNPEFPTVPNPNPEEGKSVLKLAIETAENNGSRIILANDPDADRLAVAEHPIGSEGWKIFTGNELGALLGWWMIHSYKKIHGKTHPKLVLLSSTVSSAILKSMAKIEGVKFEETLTGFKWMGNRADQLTAEGYEVLYAFEESIGYMCGNEVLDKDGISAAVKIAELAIYLENSTLSSALESIYKQYGLHLSINSYFFCNNSLIIKKIFESLRTINNQQNSYPKSILGGRYSIKSVRDLTTGYDSSTIDHIPILPVSESIQMITFNFDNGLIVTLRTSGTEPKIKYYAELCSDPENSSDINELKKVLNEMVQAIVSEFIKPHQYVQIIRRRAP